MRPQPRITSVFFIVTFCCKSFSRTLPRSRHQADHSTLKCHIMPAARGIVRSSMPERRLIQIPSDEELSSPTEWQRGPDRDYYAYRYHLLIEERRGSRQLAGPAIDTIEVASGVKYNFQIRKLVTIRFTETIQDSITTAVSNKLTHDVSSKTM